jgi:hypothetical protein
LLPTWKWANAWYWGFAVPPRTETIEVQIFLGLRGFCVLKFLN